MVIIEKCVHGKRTIGSCKACKKIYALRRQRGTARELWWSARGRAKKKNLPFEITENDIVIPKTCPVLGIALDSSDREHCPTLDEVVQGGGYTLRNTCVISGRANRLKSDATPSELAAVAKYAELRTRFSLSGIPDSW